MLGALAALPLLLLGAQAQRHRHGAGFQPHYVLEAREAGLEINCETRSSVVVNGTSPGPTLRLKEGQTSWIRVWNRMGNQNLTMHWHGLAQKAAPFSDGTPLVSQWPIPPDHYFDYEVRPEVGDAGTYFYHSHVGFQQLTAHGALIVEERDTRQPKKKYGEDVILLLSDYYRKTDHDIESGLAARPFRWSGEPQAITVQGQSGTSPFGRGRPSCQPHIIDVKPNSLYRLRTIGATGLSLVQLGIEAHEELYVIEADGTYTNPAFVKHMQVGPGQRFSFQLRTKTEAEIKAAGKTQFWVRFESRERPQSIQGYALLRYNMGKSSGPSNGASGSRPEQGTGVMSGNRRRPQNRYHRREARGWGTPHWDGGFNWDNEKFRNPFAGRPQVSAPKPPRKNPANPPPKGPLPIPGARPIFGQEDLPRKLPEASPIKDWPVTYEYLERNLTSVGGPRFPPKADREVVIQIKQTFDPETQGQDESPKGLVWAQNSYYWKEGMSNHIPYLVNFYTGKAKKPDYDEAIKNGGFDKESKTFPARVGEVIDIVWQNNKSPTGAFDVHPMHIHGEHAWDLGSGPGAYNAAKVNHLLNGRAPARRDTTFLYRYQENGQPANGWRAWRVKVTEENIGTWMMHCHIAQHAAMGMNTVWVLGEEKDLKKKFPPRHDAEVYFEYKGAAFGNDQRAADVNAYFKR